ncbi:hypothetical protein Esi_0239_0020 [Ectocarpus siliculosus]|uniref:Uncharacterized protein n=1 Tax=Ectocarpus siliculosus TaxID=2880 RepID=D7FST0_ECTSI|nr:hypothetical protein Esi_0239_0020 [Ectocarpus siliculosus]|eukprot:CBJ31221.1 hypothetical protein Esi_0239_0020 [Ectocarpus siliculosus]
MTLRTVANTVRRGCDPQTVRHLLYETDAEGLNFLMHSVAYRACQPAPVRGGENLGVSSSGSALPGASEDNVHLKRSSSIGESSVLGLGNDVVLPPDPAVPLFNVAFEFVQCSLWKAQVRVGFELTRHTTKAMLRCSTVVFEFPEVHQDWLIHLARTIEIVNKLSAQCTMINRKSVPSKTETVTPIADQRRKA